MKAGIPRWMEQSPNPQSGFTPDLLITVMNEEDDTAFGLDQFSLLVPLFVSGPSKQCSRARMVERKDVRHSCTPQVGLAGLKRATPSFPQGETCSQYYERRHCFIWFQCALFIVNALILFQE